MSNLIDISVPVFPGMGHWPGDPAVEIVPFLDFTDGHVRASKISCSLHTGTHIDAPLHHLPNGRDIEELDLHTLVGPVKIVDVGDVDRVTADVLEREVGSHAPSRLLVRTANSGKLAGSNTFDPNFVALTRDAAEWLVEQSVQLVGVDYLSVQSCHDPDPDVHVILLEADVVILEGVSLSEVDIDREYELLCLPLRIRGGDGGPCRAVLRQTS